MGAAGISLTHGGSGRVAALFQRGAELERDGVPYALVTVLRVLAPASAKPGDKALVTGDGAIHGWIGGGCAQPAVIRTVRQALADGQPRQIRVAPERTGNEALEDIIEFTMSCVSGGTLELFIDPILQKPDLVIFGQSPVAAGLASLAPRVGFRVSWVVPEGTAEAAEASADPEVALVPREELGAVRAGSYAVVATQGRGDLAALVARRRGRIAAVPADVPAAEPRAMSREVRREAMTADVTAKGGGEKKGSCCGG